MCALDLEDGVCTILNPPEDRPVCHTHKRKWIYRRVEPAEYDELRDFYLNHTENLTPEETLWQTQRMAGKMLKNSSG